MHALFWQVLYSPSLLEFSEDFTFARAAIHNFFSRMAHRDTHSQAKYRKASRSKNKDSQHVSHTVSLEIANEIQSHAHGPPSESLSGCLNNPSNFRMVDAHTNQVTHRRLDAGITEKAQTGEVLTQREQSRASQQATVLQTSKTLPKGIKNSARKFFKSLKTRNKKTVWDGRKDK